MEHTSKQCGQEFSTPEKLNVNVQSLKTNAHTINHPKEKGYVCEQCEKSFPGLDNLKKHMLFHTKEK